MEPNNHNATRPPIAAPPTIETAPPEADQSPAQATQEHTGSGMSPLANGAPINGDSSMGDGVEDLSSVLTPAEGEPPVENLNSILAPPSGLTSYYLRPGESLTGRLAQPKGVVRVAVHWMDGSDRRMPIRCNQEPGRPGRPGVACVACIAAIARVVYVHMAFYAVQQRAIVALQVPFETTPGSLLPQLHRETRDPDAARLLLTISRASRGPKYEVRRMRLLNTQEVIGDREIDDFLARGGLLGREVRDLYQGFNNAELMARWPQVADLIHVHHPEVDLSAL